MPKPGDPPRKRRKRLGRYAGCDFQGLPLDPDHPWNANLPPERRAKRLAEIEAFIAEHKEGRKDG